MSTFIIKYLAEVVAIAVAVILACMLSSDSLLLSINYDYSFIVFFACLFALMLPAYYLAAKYC